MNEQIIQAAYVISFAIVFSAISKLWYSRRPRLALATVSVGGVTAPDGEQIQGTITIFRRESMASIKEKLQLIWDLREYRLEIQNKRMIELMDAQREATLAEKAAKKAH